MYRLIGFGLVSLEHYDPMDDIGSGDTPTSYLPLPEGGAIDNFGSVQKNPGVVERVKTITIYDDSDETAVNLYLQLLALRGKRDRLYRRTITGDIHWVYARLREVKAKREGFSQKIELRFETQEAFWRGDLGGKWYLNDGEYLNTGLSLNSGQTYPLTTSPTMITISLGAATDAGRAPTRAIEITISAGASAMSNITIARANGESITFNGTVDANTDLVIDTGSMQITNDGADAYNDLVLSPTADLATWFSFLAGDNDLTISFTGGGTGKQIEFRYYEGWY